MNLETWQIAYFVMSVVNTAFKYLHVFCGIGCLYWLNYSLFSSFVTRYGDKDLDLRLANPLHLRTLLEDKRFSRCRVVLLHASYPFSREASYLASVYHQVNLLTLRKVHTRLPSHFRVTLYCAAFRYILILGWQFHILVCMAWHLQSKSFWIWLQ